MIDQIASLNLSYLIDLSKDGNLAKAQFERLTQFLIEEKCTFKGEPMPTLLKPNFLSPKQTRTLQYAVDKISSALNKFINLYLQNQQVRDIMKFSDEENDLFSIEPGYSTSLVIARHDAFMDDYSIKFLEFNCDSPAGTAYSDVLEDGFKDILKQYPALDSWKIDYYRRQERLLDALITCYNEFKTTHPSLPSQPTIAIVDWDDVATTTEFDLLQEFFEHKGYETIICSPQNFQINGGKMLVNGQQVHLIYKRVITRELLQKLDKVENFVQGIKEGFACTCNPFRSFIVENKKVLSLLTDPRFQDIYSNDELNVIERTIPWTKILADTKAIYHGFNVNLRDFIADNKDNLVLKPASSYGGKDVYLGRETDQQTWEKIMNENIESETWVIQKYVSIPQEMFPVIDETVCMQIKKININPFALLCKYSGTISRVSDSSVINVSAGGGLVPTMSVVRKKDIVPT